jgi:biotin transport system substrate-specific component
LKTRDMILISLFAALTAIGAFIKIQIGFVPFTFQFFFCAYSGVLLGSRKSFISQLLYVSIGLIGIPVFANGGGFTYIFQPTFGYLIGFMACGYVIGYLTERINTMTLPKMMASVLAGLAVVYLIGVPYLYMIVKLYLGKSTYTLMAAIASGFLPYIVPDLILSVIIATSSMYILPRLKSARLV